MKIHLVKKGETLFNIAKKYGIELQKLISFNSQLADPDKIDVGMKIKIPSDPVPAPVGAVTHKHVVVQGDTLWKLAKAWDVPLKAVIDANPHLKNPNVLMTGDIVYIPNLAEPAPAEPGGMSPENGNVEAGATEKANTAVMEQAVEPETPVVNKHAESVEMNHPTDVEAEEIKMDHPMNVEAAQTNMNHPMVEAAEHKMNHPMAEAAEHKMNHPMVEAEHKMNFPMFTEAAEQPATEFPFAQYKMPATEAFSPFPLQTAPVSPAAYGKGMEHQQAMPSMQMPQMAPMMPMVSPESIQPQPYPAYSQPMAMPQPFAMSGPWGGGNAVSPAQHKPSKKKDSADSVAGAVSPLSAGPDMTMWPTPPMAQMPTPMMQMPMTQMPMPQMPMMQMPMAHDKYPGIEGASIMPFGNDSPWPTAQTSMQTPGFGNQPFGLSPAAGGPCIPCQQGYGGYPSHMYGMPYALSANAYPESLSPHASLMQKEDCGCDGRDERTGDISLASVNEEVAPENQPTRASKSGSAKVSISTRAKTQKRRQSAAKQSKKQSGPWIRA